MAGSTGAAAFGPSLRDVGGAGAASRSVGPLVEIAEQRAALAAVRGLTEASRNAEARPGLGVTGGEEAIARPGRQLFLYGPAGCGKSRLVAEFLRLDPVAAGGPRAAGVVHLTGAGLAARLDEALGGGSGGPLREELLSARVFVLEDVAGVRAKTQTQALLVAALDAVAENGGRAVLTGPALPGELPGVSRRLVDRLRGGVLAAVPTPGAASRAVLLGRFAEAAGVAAAPAALRTLAAGFGPRASVRELEAAAGRLTTLARTAGTAGWTAEVAAAFLAGREGPPAPSLAVVSGAVAKRFGLKVAELRKAGRSAAVVPARQAGMALCRELTGEPLAAVAKHFGRSDHGTVMHALKRFEARLAADAAFRADVAAVRRALRAGG